MGGASRSKIEANTDLPQKKQTTKKKLTLHSVVWSAGASKAGCKQTNSGRSLKFTPQLATMFPLVQIANGRKSCGRG